MLSDEDRVTTDAVSSWSIMTPPGGFQCEKAHKWSAPETLWSPPATARHRGFNCERAFGPQRTFNLTEEGPLSGVKRT